MKLPDGPREVARQRTEIDHAGQDENCHEAERGEGQMATVDARGPRTLWAEESGGSDADGDTILFTFSLKMFRHADEERRLFRALVGQRSGALVHRQLDRVLSDLVRADLERLRSVGNPYTLELAVRFVVSAYVGLLTWWLDHPTPAAPEEIDQAFRALVLPGVAGFLAESPRSVTPTTSRRTPPRQQ